MASAASSGGSKDSKEMMDKNNTGVEKVKLRLALEPGKIYRFRVAAVNVAGKGPWSEESYFKVPEPEPLPVPTNIKLTAMKHGVKVSWDMSPNAKGVKEYRAFVAVNSEEGPKSEFKFMPIYTGPRKYFAIHKDTIEMAAIDVSAGTPAILLRVVAKSDMGYGPAIHIRCLKNWN